MSDLGFTQRSFAFFEELIAHNDREWYKANRDWHRDTLEQPFACMLAAASEVLTAEGIALQGGKATMFRIQRDTRFSKDKTPYKTTTSGMLTSTGTKKEMQGIVYAQIDLAGGFIGAGYYGLEPKRLAPIRQRMIDEPDKLKALLSHLKARGRTLETDMALSAMPRGFEAYKDSDMAPFIKLKSLLVREDLSREDWLNGTVVERLVALARDAQPVLEFGRV